MAPHPDRLEALMDGIEEHLSLALDATIAIIGAAPSSAVIAGAGEYLAHGHLIAAAAYDGVAAAFMTAVYGAYAVTERIIETRGVQRR